MQLLIDLDNTLINHTEAQRNASKKFGQVFKNVIPKYSEETFCDLWNETMMKYYQKFLNQEISFEDHRYFRLVELFEQPEMSKEDAKILFNKYFSLYEESWETYDDVIPFLDWCISQNHKISILTDGPTKNQNRKLQKTNINNYFDFVFTAESEKRAKPDPLFFKSVCQKLSVNPSNTYYIGDDLEKDAKGASDAGLIGVWLNRENSEYDFEGFSITTLVEFQRYIEK